MLGELRIRRAKRERADNFVAQQFGVDQARGAWKLDRELVEERCVEAAAHAGNLRKFVEGKAGLGEILMSHFAQAFFSKKCEVHRGGERAKCLVGADVGSSLFAANVLFARSEGKDETPVALSVVGLTRESPRHLADEFVARCDYPDEWPAIAGS